MATVSFEDQTTGGTWVNVASTTLSEGGFVTIHDASLLEGAVFDSVVGVSEALEAGDHEGVVVDLFEGVPGADFDREMVDDGETLIAMPHFDSNDNGTYDFLTSEGEEDGPYVDEEGEPVVDDAVVSVDHDEMDDESMATVSFEDQHGDGRTVTVAEATLSEGGFVTIHDASLLEGEVFDSVVGVSEALEPGSVEDLDVRLFCNVPGAEFDRKTVDDGETLVAMPHFDSNDNGTYDFLTSEGEEDGPYVDEEGEPVVDDANIRVC
ncbi:hypothetical protein CV102_07550 [Natronococcus pandeyae]|uniref:DUF7282 domain-containing protein n=2 Tax=Natronococcus pandeyae TaxID=2055836 RepID=A0A8J8TT24_9EURY|nr:hypothetical protein CV102_07550 [Natronococcus pandeyae]